MVYLTHLASGGDDLMNRHFSVKKPAMAGANPRVVVYVRVGAEAPTRTTDDGLSMQQQACREWCEQRGFEAVEAGELR